MEVEQAGPLCAVLRYEGEFRSSDDLLWPLAGAAVRLGGAPLPAGGVDADQRVGSGHGHAVGLVGEFELLPIGAAMADFGEFSPLTLDAIRSDPFFYSSNHLHRLRLDDLRAVPLPEYSFVSCWQHAGDSALLCSSRYRVGVAPIAPGFVRLSYDGHGMVGSMRWFREEFPKGIVVLPNELQLATVPEALDVQQSWCITPTVLIGRGEAKRQTLALWVADGPVAPPEAERLTPGVQDPPRLYDGDWFLRSQTFDTSTVVAPAGWESIFAGIADPLGVDAVRLGHREYWDTAWGNNYRGRGHLGVLRYVETGDPRWFRYFEAVCRHSCDVDIIHYSPEHPEWVGGMPSSALTTPRARRGRHRPQQRRVAGDCLLTVAATACVRRLVWRTTCCVGGVGTARHVM